MENGSQENLSPWFSMWTKPRGTIQKIVDADPERSVLMLAALAGVSEALDRASMRNMGDDLAWPSIVAFCLVVGPFAGIIGLYIGAALLNWTGGWLGGRGSSKAIRAAVAWSAVPIVWILPLWIPELALFGQDLFTARTPRLDANASLNLLFIGFGLIEATVGVWAVVVFCKSLGQVQGFSAWKALGNALLAGLVIFVPLMAILITFATLTR